MICGVHFLPVRLRCGDASSWHRWQQSQPSLPARGVKEAAAVAAALGHREDADPPELHV